MTIKIGLYSEDRTLHPLLSSALGKEFQVLLESDEEGMKKLLAAGDCDAMILDLNSNHGSLQERIEFSRRLIDSKIPSVVMADDGLRITAFELVRAGAFGYCRRPPSIRDLKTMLSRAYENSLLKQQLQTVQHHVEEPGSCSADRLERADAAGLPIGSASDQSERLRTGNGRKWDGQGTDCPCDS